MCLPLNESGLGGSFCCRSTGIAVVFFRHNFLTSHFLYIFCCVQHVMFFLIFTLTLVFHSVAPHAFLNATYTCAPIKQNMVRLHVV